MLTDVYQAMNLTKLTQQKGRGAHDLQTPGSANQLARLHLGERIGVGTPQSPSARRAFTLIELIVIITFIVLAFFVFVPATNRNKDRSRRASCANNLIMVGLAFKTFGLDSVDQYPFNLEAKNGGSLEALSTGEVFRHFQALSNELSTPKILVCPADSRQAVTNFLALANSNVSYFIGLDAKYSTPATLLTGDRNLTNSTVLPLNRILVLTTNDPVGWNHEMHKFMGNLGLADGSVQGLTLSKLRDAVSNSEMTNRLAIP
jgi:competence protein ComGC